MTKLTVNIIHFHCFSFYFCFCRNKKSKEFRRGKDSISRSETPALCRSEENQFLSQLVNVSPPITAPSSGGFRTRIL